MKWGKEGNIKESKSVSTWEDRMWRGKRTLLVIKLEWYGSQGHLGYIHTGSDRVNRG